MHKKFDRDRILSLCEPGDYGIFAPPMKAQVALDELCHYFLGDDWYSASGCTNTEQINTEIVTAIEKAYPGCKIDKKRYQAMRGMLPLEKVPVGTIFNFGGKLFRKLTNEIITDKSSKHQGNIIRLDNGHRITSRTDLWVKPLSQSEIEKMKEDWEGDISFLELPVGAVFRWYNLIGIKIKDNRVDGDWVKHPEAYESNIVDMDYYKLKTVSSNIKVKVISDKERTKQTFSTLPAGTLFVWGDTVGLKLISNSSVEFSEISVFIDMANNHASACNHDIVVLPIKEGVYHEGFTYTT